VKEAKNRAKFVSKELGKLFPEGKTELKNWKTEFQFLVCVLLSAQTTDSQVNKVTGQLFTRYPDLSSMAAAKVEEIQKCISSINYYKTKSKHIVKMSELLVETFNSDIPKDVNELIKLPGVGKKTANVFLNELFQANQGIAVDTHVARVSNRLGLSKEDNINKITLDLERLFPRKDWYKVNTRFVLFGRYHCKAKNPECENCVFRSICNYSQF
jgi:endonuclease III